MASGSVGLLQPQLPPGALPVTETQKLRGRSRLPGAALGLPGTRSAVARAQEGDDALSSPSVTRTMQSQELPRGKDFAVSSGSSSVRAPGEDCGFSPNFGGTEDFFESKESS